MPKLKLYGDEVEFETGMTVMQVCEQAGIEIPRFCYHERLSVAGNCRMCLVEVKPGPPKPAASCAMPAGDGMEVETDSEMVRTARNGVMEFMLINHPLDCPVCDQGGECDLQDQSLAFGSDKSRYTEKKRIPDEKYMGPLIKTIMTRCIHCTRCVRFSTEVAGVTDMGLLNRGEHAEISSLEKAISSELSGNLVDLCPVGALTSKPYENKARPWELKKTESIDVMDAMGCNIRIDSRGNEVLRILPRLNEDINEEWISDKTRHACDGLKNQRLDRPYIRGDDGKLVTASWDQALNAVKQGLSGLKGNEIAAIAGDQADVESMFALKELMNSIGSTNIDCRQDGAKLDNSVRASYLFNSTIAGIEDADAILIIGANPRWEAAVLNARIRKQWLTGKLKIGLIGEKLDLAYDYEYLGAGLETLAEFVSGKKSEFSDILSKAERGMLILGNSAICRDDGADILGAAHKIADRWMIKDDWNGFNMLHTAASRVGGLDIGFIPDDKNINVNKIIAAAKTGNIKAIYLLGADEIDTKALEKSFVIYQGHHGDAGATCADVILPGSAYSEKSASYVNLEGRVQMTKRAIYAPGDAKEDWAIIRALSETLGKKLDYDNLSQLRIKLREKFPHMAEIDIVPDEKWAEFGSSNKLKTGKLLTNIDNFYMTDPISRASITMANCTKEVILNTREAKISNG